MPTAENASLTYQSTTFLGITLLDAEFADMLLGTVLAELPNVRALALRPAYLPKKPSSGRPESPGLRALELFEINALFQLVDEIAHRLDSWTISEPVLSRASFQNYPLAMQKMVYHHFPHGRMDHYRDKFRALAPQACVLWLRDRAQFSEHSAPINRL